MGVAADPLEMAELLIVERPELLRQREIGEADDCVERRAQLMAHDRQELRLKPHSLQRPIACQGQLSLRPFALSDLLLRGAEKPRVVQRDRGKLREAAEN